jgi:hypothetical protein
LDKKEQNIRFNYHEIGGLQNFNCHSLRQTAKDFSNLILENCPDSRERSLAITKLEEVVMWANASIARRSKKE